MWNPGNTRVWIAKHSRGFRRKRSTRCDCPLRNDWLMQYISVDKTSGEKSEMEFFRSRAKENSDPEAILENCFGTCALIKSRTGRAHVLLPNTAYAISCSLIPRSQPSSSSSPPSAAKNTARRLSSSCSRTSALVGFLCTRPPCSPPTYSPRKAP